MSKFVFVYQGGGGAPSSPAEQEKAMAEWTTWFGTIGSDLVDVGNPFTQGKKVGSDGSVGNATLELGGYSVINAASLDAAAGVAKGCPVLSAGGIRRGVRSHRHVVDVVADVVCGRWVRAGAEPASTRLMHPLAGLSVRAIGWSDGPLGRLD